MQVIVALMLACTAGAHAQTGQVRTYRDTSLLACPAGERLEYFVYYYLHGLPAYYSDNWCGAAQKSNDWSNDTDPYRERIPYLLEECVAGQYWTYSHRLNDTRRYYSPRYRGIDLVCSVGAAQVSLIGPSRTKALPAGPVLPQAAVVTRNGSPGAGIGVTVTLTDAAGATKTFSGTTDASGVFRFTYVPPYLRPTIENLKATCTECSNEAQKQIVVEACDICTGSGGQ